MGTGRPEDQNPPVPNEHPYVQPLIDDDLVAASGDMVDQPDKYRRAVKRLRKLLRARTELGLKRYGVPGLQPFNGRDTRRDAEEEALDAAVYLKAFALETGDERDEEAYDRQLDIALYLQTRAIEREDNPDAL